MKLILLMSVDEIGLYVSVYYQLVKLTEYRVTDSCLIVIVFTLYVSEKLAVI